MPLLQVILTLAVAGFLLWLLVTYVPMVAPFKKLIIGVAVIGAVIWLLNVFGVLHYLFNIRVGTLH